MYLVLFLLVPISAPVKYIFGCSGKFFFFFWQMSFPCSVHSEEFNVAREKFPFQVFLSFTQNQTAGKNP